MYIPIFKASHDRLGCISGYLDPRLFTEAGQMIQDAKEPNTFNANMIITLWKHFHRVMLVWKAVLENR